MEEILCTYCVCVFNRDRKGHSRNLGVHYEHILCANWPEILKLSVTCVISGATTFHKLLTLALESKW